MCVWLGGGRGAPLQLLDLPRDVSQQVLVDLRRGRPQNLRHVSCTSTQTPHTTHTTSTRTHAHTHTRHTHTHQNAKRPGSRSGQGGLTPEAATPPSPKLSSWSCSLGRPARACQRERGAPPRAPWGVPGGNKAAGRAGGRRRAGGGGPHLLFCATTSLYFSSEM